MIITATELKMNLGKYLDIVAREDIIITKNGHTIAKLVNPNVSAVKSLRGMLEGFSVDPDAEREARLEERADHDRH